MRIEFCRTSQVSTACSTCTNLFRRRVPNFSVSPTDASFTIFLQSPVDVPDSEDVSLHISEGVVQGSLAPINIAPRPVNVANI